MIVTVDIGGIEWNWPADPDAVFFTDELGVVFVSNRGELTLSQRDPAAPRAGRNAD